MSSLIVDVTEIKEITPHPNADRLEIATIKGWSVITGKGNHKPGDKVVYVPPDSILPLELSDRMDVTKYLSNQRVRSIKLRGVVSCGMIMPNEGNWTLGTNVAAHYGITKWEPPAVMGGECVHAPDQFHHYTDIENWNNFPDIFKNGEEVIITEKIHGTNWRAGMIDGKFYVGSHHTAKAYNADNLYWRVAIKYDIEGCLRTIHEEFNTIIFGEIFGRVQDLKYGLINDYDLRIFDISENGQYMDQFEENRRWLDEFSLAFKVPTVPQIYKGPYSVKLINELCQGNAFQGDHIKEGIVIRPIKERWDPTLGRVILKKINPEYMVRKGGTEHH